MIETLKHFQIFEMSAKSLHLSCFLSDQLYKEYLEQIFSRIIQNEI